MRKRRTNGHTSVPLPVPENDLARAATPISTHVNDLISLCIRTFIGLYYDILDLPYRMALGLGRWWGSRDEVEEDGEEEMRLLGKPAVESKKKVRRRRRKEDTSSRLSCPSSF